MKWIIRVGIVLLVLAVAGFIFRQQIAVALFSMATKPSDAFESYDPPPPLDYADNASWAALPETGDPADIEHAGFIDNQASASVAVFFVHPTTFYKKSGWNASVDAKDARDLIDNFVLASQASAFNGSGAIYAPHYRQATIFSFMDDTGSGEKALELAYSDVERAFENFLTRIGEDTPFILAAHSQGALHVGNLMKQRISGTPLTERLIAAYPVGFALDAADMETNAPDIPICTAPSQTGCYASWATFGENAAFSPLMSGSVCVNPLSWRADTEAVPASENPGSLPLSSDGEPKEPVAGTASAQCQSGHLVTGPFETDLYEGVNWRLGRENYHLGDFNIYYASIRENVAERVGVWTAPQPD